MAVCTKTVGIRYKRCAYDCLVTEPYYKVWLGLAELRIYLLFFNQYISVSSLLHLAPHEVIFLLSFLSTAWRFRNARNKRTRCVTSIKMSDIRSVRSGAVAEPGYSVSSYNPEPTRARELDRSRALPHQHHWSIAWIMEDGAANWAFCTKIAWRHTHRKIHQH